MTNPKITRKDAERAKETAIKACDAWVVGLPDVAAILRRCRIIEPGGLDAETLRWAADKSGWDTATYLRARADAIEKGE